VSKEKMNLQQFADRHGLQVDHDIIRGPRGEIFQAYAGWSYFQPGIGYQKFNPVTQAKRAIEAIGFEYMDKLLIVSKPDGWYVADNAGAFKTRELARKARESLKVYLQEMAKKTT
jgi:hypothetical protein